MVPFVMVAGFSNTGKTMLVERLIRVFRKRDYRVAAVKHAPHGYEPDIRGKDTWRYCQAGAEDVFVVGPASLTRHIFYRQEPPLCDILNCINDLDLIIVEGFKSQPGPKIEVVREGYSVQRLDLGNDLIAVVSDLPLNETVPCFAPDQVERLADFLIGHFSLRTP